MSRKSFFCTVLLLVPVYLAGVMVPQAGFLTWGDTIAVTDGQPTGASDLSAALAKIGSGQKTLYINATCTLTSNATIPENIQLIFGPGGRFVTGTSTVTIHSTITAGRFQIFDDSGGGKVLISATWTPVIYPHWWMSKPQAVGWASVIQKAINAYKDNPYNAEYSGTVDAGSVNFDFSQYSHSGQSPGFQLTGWNKGNIYNHFFGHWDTAFNIFGGKGRTNDGTDPNLVLHNTAYAGFRKPSFLVRRGADTNFTTEWGITFSDGFNALPNVDNTDLVIAAHQRDSYNVGTATFAFGSTTVLVYNANLTTNHISGILVDDSNNYSGIISNVTGTSPATVTLYEAWAGPSATGTTYFIQGGKGSLARVLFHLGQNGVVILNGDKGIGEANENETRLTAELGYSYRFFGAMAKGGANLPGCQAVFESKSTSTGYTGIIFRDRAFSGTPSASIMLRKVPGNGSYLQFGDGDPANAPWATISSAGVGIPASTTLRFAVTATPTSPVEGDVFFSSHDRHLRIYASGAWICMTD